MPKKSTSKGKTRAAIYCRISSDREGRGLNVQAQERDCRDACRAEDWEVISVFVDNNKTAADPNKPRPEYERLMSEVARKRFDVVVVYREDRLQRQPIELEHFVRDAKSAGMTKLYSVKSGMTDLADHSALMTLRIKGDVAAHEVDMTRDRIKRKMLDKAERGEWHGGRRPFGYKHGGMEIFLPEAALLKQAAQKILDGGSLRSIAKDWKAQGIKSPGGKYMDEGSIKKCLCALRIVGRSQHQGQDMGPAKWPPILDRATWEGVRKILTDPARRRMPRVSRSYPLRGVLKCGLCGTMLTASPRSDGRRYVCHSRHGCGKISVNADMYEQHILSILLPMADDPDLRDVIRSADEGSATEMKEILVANAEDEATIKELAEQRLAPVDLTTAVNPYRADIEARTARLHTLRGKSALSRLGGDVRSEWHQMSAEDRRAILLSLVEYIEVKPSARQGRNKFDMKRLHIVFRYESMKPIIDGMKNRSEQWRLFPVWSYKPKSELGDLGSIGVSPGKKS